MYNVKDGRRGEVISLFDILGNMGDGYLQEAYLTDDAEKMEALKREEKIKKRAERAGRGFYYRAVACLVCFATVVCAVFFSYIRERTLPSGVIWDGFEMIDGEVKIDGIDSLNYYSARRVLSTEMRGIASDVLFSTISYDVNTKDGNGKDANGGMFYYEFDPSWDYTVTKVIYFKAELKECNGFLAEKLGGIGEVDVIITENSIEDMITFRRGSHYYSCNINSSFYEGRSERLEFSTHKYIDGFGIVKNTEQDNYTLKVLIEKGRVVELDCDFDECPDGVWDFEADRISVINGSSITVETDATFNITDLEAFFNSTALAPIELLLERKKRLFDLWDL